MTPERLSPVLEREHLQWIQEVIAVVEPASRPDAGVWARWSALRYLQTTFPERLERERRLVEGLAADLTDDQREILWALAELLDALRRQLDHLIGLCHQAPQFALVTGKILTTLQHWCRAVEEGLGPRVIAIMPRPSREVLALIDPEFAAAGA
jgi:AcrR family transcriptional regulator